MGCVGVKDDWSNGVRGLRGLMGLECGNALFNWQAGKEEWAAVVDCAWKIRRRLGREEKNDLWLAKFVFSAGLPDCPLLLIIIIQYLLMLFNGTCACPQARVFKHVLSPHLPGRMQGKRELYVASGNPVYSRGRFILSFHSYFSGDSKLLSLCHNLCCFAITFHCLIYIFSP